MRWIQTQALTPEQLARALELQTTIQHLEPLDLKMGLDYQPALAQEDLPWFRHHLVLEGDRLVAYGSILGARSMPELKVMVHPDFRRQGLGSRLLDTLVDSCQVPGTEKVLGICEALSVGGQALMARRQAPLEFSEHRMVLPLLNQHPPELPAGVQVGRAGPRDAEAIAEGALHDFAFSMDVDALRQELTDQPEPHWALRVHGRLAANLRVFEAEGRAGIYAFRVHPDFRRQGLGRLLMQQVLWHLQEQGFVGVWLEVNSSNPAAIALYQQLGFVASVSYGYHRL